MNPMTSWLILLGVIGLVTAGTFALVGQLGRAEQAANEPLEEGWRQLDTEPEATVRVIRPPYDRTQEDDPI